MSYSSGAFPMQEPNVKIFKVPLFRLVSKPSKLYPRTAMQSSISLPYNKRVSRPTIATFSCILASVPTAPSPLGTLFLPQYLSQPWASFKKHKLKSHIGNNIRCYRPSPQNCLSTPTVNTTILFGTKTISSCFTFIAFISTTWLEAPWGQKSACISVSLLPQS